MDSLGYLYPKNHLEISKTSQVLGHKWFAFDTKTVGTFLRLLLQSNVVKRENTS